MVLTAAASSAALAQPLGGVAASVSVSSWKPQNVHCPHKGCRGSTWKVPDLPWASSCFFFVRWMCLASGVITFCLIIHCRVQITQMTAIFFVSPHPTCNAGKGEKMLYTYHLTLLRVQLYRFAWDCRDEGCFCESCSWTNLLLLHNINKA